jgi:2-hydroxy-6-oxonona-2,4-dienedioate hydrolase
MSAERSTRDRPSMRSPSAEQRYREAEATLWGTVGLSPSEHHVRLATTGTTVRVQEVGTGEPALFVHGGPNAGSTWAPMVAHLDGFRCLLVDRPGTGLSAPYPITASNLPRIGAAFVSDVLDGLGIDRSHVVASSFGGHLALRSAAAHPDRFRRMVQMACPALSPGEQAPPFMRLITRRWIRRIMNALPPNERVSRSILRQIGHGRSLDAGRISQGFLDWYLALQRHTDTVRNDGELIGQVVPQRSAVTLSDDLLRAARVPTLFWWGIDDTFGGEGVARHLAAVMPDAELTMVPDAGHLPWLDDPEGAARATVAFLGTGVGRRGGAEVGSR